MAKTMAHSYLAHYKSPCLHCRQPKVANVYFKSLITSGYLALSSIYTTVADPTIFLSSRHSAKKPVMIKSTITCIFTGIVEEMGNVQELGPTSDGGFQMKIAAKTVLGGVQLGDSIAVNGTCLTVSEFDLNESTFTIGLAPETLRKTSLGELKPGSFVNLERALQPISRMGGHFVQGHVDGTGEIVSLEPEEDSLWVKVRTSPELLRYIVPKGFITVDGTSLTVVKVYEEEECFDFMLVAYTQQKVVIPLKKVGNKVNLEVDILGKYVEKLFPSIQYSKS